MATLYSVGRPRDPHITRVHDYLSAYGIDAVLVPSWTPDPSAFLSVSWSLASGWSFPDDCAFWLRNKHRVGAITSVQKQDEWWSFSSTMDFMRAAADHAPISFNGSREPAATDSKIAQLEVARICGFRLPDTLVSNDKDEILAFLDEHPDAIVKPLTSAAILPIGDDLSTSRYLPTMRVRTQDVRAQESGAFVLAPGIFQGLVEKKHELRVIAFGEEIVTFKLDSQARSFTSLDWRAGEPLVECVRVETPAEIVSPIRAFLALSGLHSTVFDFAVTPDEEVVFFESNPAGQWARMDGLNGFAVSQMFARQMASVIHGHFKSEHPPAIALAI